METTIMGYIGYILGLYIGVIIGKLKFRQHNGIGEFPKIGGPQYRPPNTIVLIMGTLRMVPLILGNPHI